MNLEKIGVFISEMRKQKGLTQQELADKLHLSNRAISKWECGKGIPDSSVMMELCDVLGISVNELLSGETLSGENYIAKANENVIALMQEPEKTYKKELLSMIRSVVCGVIFLLFIVFCICLNIMGAAQALDYIDFPSILIVVGAICLALITSGLHKDFGRACKLYFTNTTASKDVRHRAYIAVKTASLTAILSGTILTIASAICSLLYTSPQDSLALPVVLSIAMLGFLYGCIIALLMVPMIGKLHILQIEKEEEDL